MKWFHLFLLKPISKLLGFIFSKNGAVFSIAIAIHSLANFLINILLAGYLALHKPLIESMVWIFVASVLKVVVLVKIYDHFKTDVFGLEMLKGGQIDDQKIVRTIKKVLHRLERRGKFLTHTALIIADHVIGVIYIRTEHRAYRGIPLRDWPAISLALLISTPVMVLGWEILIKIFWVLYIHLGLEGGLISLSVVLICIFLFKKFKKRYRQ